MSQPLVIYLHSCAYDRIYQAVNLLLTASSMGRKCYLFLFYQALAAYVADGWDETKVSGPLDQSERAARWDKKLEKAFELANAPSLYKILEAAKNESGGVTVCACSASTHLLGLAPAGVREKVDEIAGLATMLEISSRGGEILYI